MGDVILPGIDWEAFYSLNENESAVLDILDELHFAQLNRFKTTATKTLDVLLTDASSNELDIRVEENVEKSFSILEKPCLNHKPIIFEISRPGSSPPQIKQNSKFSFCLRKIRNFPKFLTKLHFFRNAGQT